MEEVTICKYFVRCTHCGGDFFGKVCGLEKNKAHISFENEKKKIFTSCTHLKKKIYFFLH